MRHSPGTCAAGAALACLWGRAFPARVGQTRQPRIAPPRPTDASHPASIAGGAADPNPTCGRAAGHASECPVTGQRGAASRVSTTVGASAATHTPHWASDCALPPALPRLPTCVVTGGLSPLRARPRRLERSRFASRRSAHGSRPCLGGPIQPPTACYRHSQPQRGPNAARNMALYAGALWRLRCSPPFTQAAGFGRGEVHVCRNQRVVRAELIARRHRGLGARERPGRLCPAQACDAVRSTRSSSSTAARLPSI